MYHDINKIFYSNLHEFQIGQHMYVLCELLVCSVPPPPRNASTKELLDYTKALRFGLQQSDMVSQLISMHIQ